MNKVFRLALLSDWHKNSVPQVIDFTRYDLKAVEPADPSPEQSTKDWSLMNRINPKGMRPQDTPRPLQELEKRDQELIKKYYPKLF